MYPLDGLQFGFKCQCSCSPHASLEILADAVPQSPFDFSHAIGELQPAKEPFGLFQVDGYSFVGCCTGQNAEGDFLAIDQNTV